MQPDTQCVLVITKTTLKEEELKMQHADNMTFRNDTECNRHLAERINDHMTNAVMPITIFVGIELFVGFFGNLAVLYVFFFKYHTCNFRYFVLFLALTDLTSTVTTMPGVMVTRTHWYVYPDRMVCKIKSFFNMFTVWSEALCLLTIAVDRYRKVCHPHDWQIKKHVAKWLCLGIFAIAFVLAFPVSFYWGTQIAIKHCDWNGTTLNVTVTLCETDDTYFIVNSKQPQTYTSCVSAFFGISVSCILVLYILIAKKLLCNESQIHVVRGKNVSSSPTQIPPPSDGKVKPSYEKAPKNSADENRYVKPTVRTVRESKVRRKTLIMFILTAIFVVTTVTYMILLYLIADDFLTKLTDTEKAVYFFFFRLYFINHVINPFVYGLLDANFRKIISNCKRSGQSVGQSLST